MRDIIRRLKDGSREATSRTGAENLVWVFGMIRTGSTWLGKMMGDLPECAMWNEPRVGELFGHFFYERAAHRRENRNFIMSDAHRDIWLESLRNFILDSAESRYPKQLRDSQLVIKEPSGSIGAPLIMEALPESRMVFLVRDPRDVVASALDAARQGSWGSQLAGIRRRRETMDDESRKRVARRAEEKTDKFVKSRANMYLRFVGNSKEAYESHEGPKSLVRYEDLRADTLKEMKRLYSELGIKVGEEELSRVVERHAWENIPEEEKGEGKFARRGRAGSWREDLTPEQVKIVEGITAPLLEEFYPGEERI